MATRESGGCVQSPRDVIEQELRHPMSRYTACLDEVADNIVEALAVAGYVIVQHDGTASESEDDPQWLLDGDDAP